MRTLIIRASEWARGGKLTMNHLFNPNNTFCCLGLDLRERGMQPMLFYNIQGPASLCESRPGTLIPQDYVTDWVIERDDDLYLSPRPSRDATEAMAINDDLYLTDEQRIEKLRPIFLSKGIEIDWRPNE